ncbi:MAG TPA: hypothetical protein VN259_07430 [Xanthomonadales bacterium]|nr:hypothetical protein [Xanthomonadales bacterium]
MSTFRQDKPLSLAGCERMLRSALGANAPALITLRRHARAGLLDSCRHPVADNAAGRARSLYIPSAILAVYRARGDDSGGAGAEADTSSQGQGAAAGHCPAPASANLAQEITPELLAALQSVRKDQAQIHSVLSELSERIAGLSAQVRDLNAVRTALMAKYDAAALAASERAERLEQENRTLRRMDDPNARTLARIQMDLAKVLERLQTMNKGENDAH